MSRRPPRAPRSLRGLLSAAALLACLAAIGAALSGSFTVQRVVVVGSGLPTATIVSAAQLSGKNIFRLRADQVVSRLDQQVHQIAVTRVATSFPNQVTIYARLRRPLVAWQSNQGLVLLDAEGWIIGSVAKTNLPIISGDGAARGVPPSIIRAVSYAFRVLPASGPGAINAFQVQPRTGLVIVDRSGWSADIGHGTAQTLVNRIATLGSVLQAIQAQGKRLQFIDLRYRVPYIRYVGG